MGNQLLKPGEFVGIGASGGKDSTVLAYVLSELNRRRRYGFHLFLLSVDEDITGYSDDAVETVKRNELQALDHGATLQKVDELVTGHYADDIAETVLLNILQGDIARLSRCTLITTGEDRPIPRRKPFKYTYEKEIVMYAYFRKLDYFSTECIYSPTNAYCGFAREFIKDLERIRPRAILDIIKSGEDFKIFTSTKMPEQGTCERCGYISKMV